jgi:hypothetical protein
VEWILFLKNNFDRIHRINRIVFFPLSGREQKNQSPSANKPNNYANKKVSKLDLVSLIEKCRQLEQQWYDLCNFR